MSKRRQVDDTSEDIVYDNSSLSSAVDRFVHGMDYSKEYLDTAMSTMGNPGLAMLLSGSDDKKSKEYKAALRRIQIWRKEGTGPSNAKTSAKYRDRLKGIAIVKGHVNMQNTKARVTYTGKKIFASYLVDHRFHVTLSDGMLEDYLKSVLFAQFEKAQDIFAHGDTQRPYDGEIQLTNDSHVFIERIDN